MSDSGSSPEIPTLPTRTIRVFISSTFGDLKAERNELQSKVFPRLRRYCERLGWAFQAIDLRWGVSTEAALDQGTMKICLAEIARCQNVTPRPNFVILMGNRYGWRPLPAEIPDDEFAVLSGELDSALKEWYKLDSNAADAVWVLQPRSGRFADQRTWEFEVEYPLHKALRSAASRAGFSARQMLKYEASATEQEIHAGALARPDAGEHVFAFFRELRNPAGMPFAARPELREYIDLTPELEIDSEAAASLASLKQRLIAHLGARRVHSREVTWDRDGLSVDHLGWLCLQVYRNLRRTIRGQIHQKHELSPTREEQLRHEEFAFKRARDFTGQASAKGLISGYVEGGESLPPLVFYGPSGSGKSALLAATALECKKSGRPTICRFAGITAESTQAAQLLTGICHEIDWLRGETSSELPLDFDLLVNAFHQRLEHSSAERPLTLFVDALDQISAPNWSWLPQALPPHTRIVVSTTQGPALDRLRSRLSASRFQQLEPMDVEDARSLLNQWLQRAERRLTPPQASIVMDGFATCRLPLYMRLAFEEARLWHSYDSGAPLPTDIDGMVVQLLNRLSQEKNHGRVLVGRVAGYLVSSRRGLTENEMLDLLARDKDYWDHFSQRVARHDLPARQLPPAIWLRLYQDLSPYLSWRSVGGTALFTFFHASFAAVAERWYPSGNWSDQTAHRRMGAYFQSMATPKRRGQWTAGPVRALSELSYQRSWDIRRRNREHLFCDIGFVAAAIARGLLYELLEDLQRAEVLPMRDAVLSGLGAIHERPDLAEVIVLNRLRSRTLPPIFDAFQKRTEAELDRRGTWLSAQTPFGNERTVTGVISVSPLRGVFHAVRDEHSLEEYSLASYQLLGRRVLPSGVNKESLIFDPVNDRIAWTDEGVVYLDGERLPIQVRYPPHCLGFFEGLIAIDEADSLVWFSAKHRTTSILATNISPAFAAIAFSPDHHAAVLIDGDRLLDQRILLLRIEAGEARATEWMRPPFPVCSACLNEAASAVVLATRGRSLKIYDITTGSLLKEATYRVAAGTPVRGLAMDCCALTVEDRLYCLLATNEGELLAWDTATDVVRRRGVYRGLRESDRLQALEPDPTERRFIVATTKWIQSLSSDGEDITTSKVPVTQCSYWPDGWLVIASASAKAVTWFEKRVWRGDFIYATHEPVTVAAHGNGGAAYVGYKSGAVVQLEPGRTPEFEDALDLFDHAVRAVMPIDGGRVLAISERGELKIARFRPANVDRILRHIETLRDEQFVCWLGKPGDFVSCGRCHAGDAHTSVVVVRENDSRETILKTRDLAVALAAGADGATVYVAFNGKVMRFRHQDGWWITEGERKTTVEAMHGTASGTLAIVRHERGCGWLELWSGSEDMRTMASAELPLDCTSLTVNGQVIAIGAIDGSYCLMEIRNERGQGNETIQARQ